MNLWLTCSIAAVLANTGKVLYVKVRCAEIDAWALVFYARLFPGIILCITLLFFDFEITAPCRFWCATVATAVLTLLASILYINALKEGYLSIVVPLQGSIPLFMVVCTGILYQEIPTPRAFFFILLIIISVSATLFLASRANITAKIYDSKRLWLPLLASIAAAALFGISTVLDRVAVSAATPGALVYSAYWHLVTTGLLFPIMYWRSRRYILSSRQFVTVIPYTVLVLAAFILQQLAVQYSLTIENGVTYVKSIVMMHISLVAFISIFVLKETIHWALLGSGLMTLVSGIGLVLSI